MDLMGDHFWPSVYPGIIVGLMYGLAVGGKLQAAVGALGGFLAAALALAMFGPTLSQEGLLPLAALLGTALLGAALAVWATGLVAGPRAAQKPTDP